MVEMWVEIIDSLEARRTPMIQLSKPEPEEYEMRFIIWRVDGLPL
jgi:hypothetical protein